MGVKVATNCLHWSQPIVPHSPSSQALASAISSPSSTSSKRRNGSDGATLVCRFVHRSEGTSIFRTSSASKLYRSRSCEHPKDRVQTIKRACSASLDAFSDEEFSRKIHELALRFQLSDDDDQYTDTESEILSEFRDDLSDVGSSEIDSGNHYIQNESQFLALKPDPVEEPNYPDREEMTPASIERKANSVDIPLSLRIIKRKKQWQGELKEVGEIAYCSVKRAFSSMVFIIRELHSFTLQMREVLLYEDLQGILVRVQQEMHASFVWLFQQVFSHTPTLMVYVMILLANFTVTSMASNTAIAAQPLTISQTDTVTTETVSAIRDNHNHQKFDSSAIKSFSVSSSSSNKSTSIGGNNGGGGKIPPVASGTDGEGWFDSSNNQQRILPDGTPNVSSFGNPTAAREEESVSGQVGTEEEMRLWHSIVEEAHRMQGLRDNALDQEIMKKFVSPVTAMIEADDYADYFRTELLYQTSLLHQPNNPLLLANYAQFLLLVAHDYDRAEEYFKRAVAVEPKDAEAYNKYASFLWRVRNDLWAAEETYLEAISADPGNSFYAADYAHFLWSTGGEDTCFPLDAPDSTSSNPFDV